MATMDTSVETSNGSEKNDSNDNKEHHENGAAVCEYSSPIVLSTNVNPTLCLIRNSAKFRFHPNDRMTSMKPYMSTSTFSIGENPISLLQKKLECNERRMQVNIPSKTLKNLRACECLPGIRRRGYFPYEMRRKCFCTCILNRRMTSKLTSFASVVGVIGEYRLRIAAATNNTEGVSMLLAAGVNPDSHDDQLRTSLHLAACRGFTDIVRLLLQSGADPNKKDSLGNTPLHLAACTNHVEVVTLLLKAGTDVKSNDHYGRNPLQLAQSKLKLLQHGTLNDDSQKIKEEVKKVIDMMMTFLHKKGQDTELELLNAFQTRLSLSQTKEEVETDVRDLLTSLDNLSLNKETSQ